MREDEFADFGDVAEALLAAVWRELKAAGQLDTSLGQQALLIATRIPDATSTSLAPMSKELRDLMRAATGNSKGIADPLDELKQRRDRKSG